MDKYALCYVMHNNKVEGPVFAELVLKKLAQNELFWTDYVWCRGTQPAWTALCDMEFFRTVFPKAPANELIAGFMNVQTKPAEKAVKPDLESELYAEVWHLKSDVYQYGPLSLADIQLIICANDFPIEKLVIRREGKERWFPVKDVPELKLTMTNPKEVLKVPVHERRRHGRKILVGTVKYSISGDLNLGVPFRGYCRDISRSGMSIISNQIPGYSGASISLVLSALPGAGTFQLETEATVVRVQESLQGFAVEFKNMPPERQMSLVRFLSSMGVN